MGAADVKHYKCREIKCAVLLEDDHHHSEIDHRLKKDMKKTASRVIKEVEMKTICPWLESELN